MKILGVETSCDETAAAVVESDGKGKYTLLSNVVASSIDLHKQYGGVVPEIAARSHIESINPVINQALEQAFLMSKEQKANNSAHSSMLNAHQFDPWEQIDAIAVTYGPGLGGSLLVGILAARTLAIIKNKPLLPVNHVEAHAYAAFINDVAPSLSTSYKLQPAKPNFPILSLIVSGGHTQLVIFYDHFKYEVLGKTHDDAVGEAFDKVAKVLGLPYPGGPSIEDAAKKGDPHKFKLPSPKTKDSYGFSYSGLKTAVLRTAQKTCGKSYDFPSHQLAELLSEEQKNDLAASFQQTALSQLVNKTFVAYQQYQPASIVLAGGVAASSRLRQMLSDKMPIPVTFADPKLCTDNGAMIATYGCVALDKGQKPTDPYTLDVNPGLSM